MRTCLYAILAAAIATTAHGQVSATITDLGRDGAPDQLDPLGSHIRLTAEVETRFCNEFAIPPRDIDFRWADLACRVLGYGWELEHRLEFAVYAADGAITPADFAREPVVVYELSRVPAWDHTPEVRVPVRPLIDQLLADGVLWIGVRVRLIEEHPSSETFLWPYDDRLLDTGQSCAHCFADFDDSGGVDGDDVHTFIRAWQGGYPCADVDRSGGVDGQDIPYFFYYWQNGGC